MSPQPPKSHRRRQSNTPKTPPTLPEELITDILSRLTVKHLMQMKCVSKSWNTLITDPVFTKMHFSRSALNPFFSLISNNLSARDGDCSFVTVPVNRLLENRYITVPKSPYFRLRDKECRDVVGSCNGLVCLIGYSINEWTKYKRVWFRFWNPATRSISEKLGYFFYYDKNERKSIKFVFGYDNSTDTYKVVMLRSGCESDPESKVSAKAFSFGGNVWRNIQSFPVVPLQLVMDPRENNGVVKENDGVYLSGSINWLAYRDDDNLRKDNPVEKYVIVSLDLGTETNTQFLLPEGFEKESYVGPSVCVLKDSLCFCHDLDLTDFVIWQMMEFGNEKSWTQFLKFSYHSVRMNYEFGLPLLKLMPLHLSENGDTVVLANNRQDRVILYNRRNNRARKTILNTKICWPSLKDYVESLVSTS
ncbi:hypothetical protein RYX36_029150 [Vicia faba]